MKANKSKSNKPKNTSTSNKLKSKTKPVSTISASQRKPIGLFLVKFFVIFGVANILIEFANLSVLTNLLAHLTGGLLGLSVSASTILAGSQAFVITNSCTGLVSASVLGAIIFSLRKPSFGIKLALFLWGSIALLIFNIPRIMLVLVAARAGLDAELIHEATWFVMSAIVLAIWYFGTKRITKVRDFSELV